MASAGQTRTRTSTRTGHGHYRQHGKSAIMGEVVVIIHLTWAVVHVEEKRKMMRE
jgi:hypothetical protein